MKKIQLKTKHYVLIGVILVIIGIALIFSDYFMEKKYKVYESINLSTESLPDIIEDGEKPEIIIEEEQPEQKPQSNPDYYIGTLRIPKISFYKGYTSIDSPYNDVDYNINVLKYSQYPNIEKGNFIVAGHSGSAWNSFFKDLYRLEVGDKAYVTYEGIEYEYTIKKIYYQPKTGTIKLYRDVDATTMTLITCTKNDKKSQTIYILER